MSSNNESNTRNNNNSNNSSAAKKIVENGSKDRKRSPSPNPFMNYISTSPSQVSPRSDSGSATSASPRSPRFQTEGFHPNGMRIPLNGSSASISNAMLTAGKLRKLTKPQEMQNVKSFSLPLASPPRFATIEQFMNAANAVHNMALAHEISVNQNFKLEKLELDPNR